MNEEFGVDRRSSGRFALKAAVSIRIPGRAREPARLLDLSTGGCRLMTRTPLPPDTTLWLMIGHFPPLYCHTAWGAGPFAGIRFAVEMEDSQVAELIDLYGKLSERDADELRRLSEQCSRLAATQRNEDREQGHVAALGEDCQRAAIAFEEAHRQQRIEALLSRLSVGPGAS